MPSLKNDLFCAKFDWNSKWFWRRSQKWFWRRSLIVISAFSPCPYYLPLGKVCGPSHEPLPKDAFKVVLRWNWPSGFGELFLKLSIQGDIFKIYKGVLSTAILLPEHSVISPLFVMLHMLPKDVPISEAPLTEITLVGFYSIMWRHVPTKV